MATAVRILAVDDERLLRMSLRVILAREGFQVDTAGTVAEAAALLDRHHYDLVLTDLNLPDATGFEVLGHARAADSSVKVILLTASAEQLSLEAATAAGAEDIIAKPFKLATLVERAREALGQRAEVMSRL